MFPIPGELTHRIFISRQVPVYSPSATTSATVLDMMTLCLLPCYPSPPGDTARCIQPRPGDLWLGCPASNSNLPETLWVPEHTGPSALYSLFPLVPAFFI